MPLYSYSFTLLIVIITGLIYDAFAVDVAKATSPSMMEPECSSWANLQHSVESAEPFSLQNIKLVCRVNDDCQGISCNGKSMDMKWTIGAHVEHPCSKPVSLLVALKVPEMRMDWTHTFVLGGDKISLFEGEKQVQVNMQMLTENTLVLGVSLLKSPMSTINIINNQTIVLPPCSRSVKRKLILPVSADQDNESKVVLGTVTSDGKSCSLTELGECGPGETCEQMEPKRPQGECKCLPHYHRNLQGACEPDPTVPSSTDDPSAQSQTSNDDGSLADVVVGVSIFVVTIVLTIVVISAYKYRWVPRIRARFQRARPYEEMIIDGDDSQSTNMSNPIA